MQDIFGLDQRKSASKWQAFTFQLGVTLIAAGLLAMLFTALRSFGAAELLGQVLGLLLLGSGVMAVAGSSKRSTHFMTASLTVSILGILLAFEFIAEVNREARVDCALAELYTKSLATERILQEQKHVEVLTKLYVRMNEMEEQMASVQTGAIKSLQLIEAQDKLKFDDHSYIQQKMRVMKNHADTLLDNILNHPNLTEPQITQMPLSQKEDLRRRVKVADDVIDNVIHKYEQGSQGAEVFQEYEKGLHALLGAFKASSPGQHFQIAEQDSSRLEKMAGELVHMQAALDRASADEYHKLDPQGHGQELQALQNHRTQKQHDFSNQFLSLLHQHEMTKHTDYLQDLPQQCVVENRNEKMMVSLGLTAMLLELSAMYCTLSCILVMPGKRD
ncbi:hypothetical protein ABBQ38_007411 [Trebouxia sp. C0009 RCD-2024]